MEITWQKLFDRLIKQGIDGQPKNPSGLKKDSQSSVGSPFWSVCELSGTAKYWKWKGALIC